MIQVELLLTILAKRYSAQQAINDPWIKKYTNPTVVEQPLMKKVLTNMRNFRVRSGYILGPLKIARGVSEIHRELFGHQR